eukprot:4849260-Amphidinium_carterae.1
MVTSPTSRLVTDLMRSCAFTRVSASGRLGDWGADAAMAQAGNKSERLRFKCQELGVKQERFESKTIGITIKGLELNTKTEFANSKLLELIGCSDKVDRTWQALTNALSSTLRGSSATLACVVHCQQSTRV